MQRYKLFSVSAMFWAVSYQKGILFIPKEGHSYLGRNFYVVVTFLHEDSHMAVRHVNPGGEEDHHNSAGIGTQHPLTIHSDILSHPL